jgi:hypothetical protein
MSYEDAVEIRELDLIGRYRGERSRLIRAIEIVNGETPPGVEEVETIYGALELGGEG